MQFPVRTSLHSFEPHVLHTSPIWPPVDYESTDWSLCKQEDDDGMQDNYFELAYCLTALMTGIIMGGCGPVYKKSELTTVWDEFQAIMPELKRFNLWS